MASPKLSKSSKKGRSAKSKRGMPARSHASAIKSGFDEVWENFVDDLVREIRNCVDLPKEQRTPYYSPSSVLKRKVYAFVLDHRKKTASNIVEDAIDSYRLDKIENKLKKSGRPFRKNYDENPFYFVFSGLLSRFPIYGFQKDEKNPENYRKYDFKQYDATRYGQLLDYAYRHRVVERILIGFLMQTGTDAQIIKKSKDINARESWFIERQNRIKK